MIDDAMVVALARAACKQAGHHDPDQPMAWGAPFQVWTPSGLVYSAPNHQFPLWQAWRYAAEQALKLAADQLAAPENQPTGTGLSPATRGTDV